MAARKLSAAATGGRMLNPSVEPTARRESIQAKHDAEGNARRDSTGRASREKGARVEGASSADYVRQGTDPTASITALEARDHRRSIGLKVRILGAPIAGVHSEHHHTWYFILSCGGARNISLRTALTTAVFEDLKRPCLPLLCAST